jgi:CRP-like cAMP-binding protein
MKAVKELALASKGAETHPAPRDLDDIIAEHPFLEGLSPHQARILKDCAMFTRFRAGEILFREGDPANRFYLILHGKVSLEAHVQNQGVTPIQAVEDGEVLGWSWLFPPYYWHFDARAVEDTEAVFFYGTPLREECEADHDLGYEMVKRVARVMMERLQSTRRKLLSTSADR